MYKLFLQDFVSHHSYLKKTPEELKLTGKREVSLSGDISVSKIRQHSKALGMTFTEYCLAAISVAAHRITEGKEKLPFNSTLAISVGGQTVTSKDTFEPQNNLSVGFMAIQPFQTLAEAATYCKKALAPYTSQLYMSLWVI